MIEIQLPDGKIIKEKPGVTISDIASQIGPGLARAALAGKINGQIVDLSFAIGESGKLEIITDKDAPSLEIIRHSTAHLMAQAVKELFPSAQVTIGPAIETGFYYDFDVSEPFTDQDLLKIEKRMEELVQKDLAIEREVISKQEALSRFKGFKEDFKVEIIKEIPGDTVSIYHQGEFQDLCRGPHVPSTGKLRAFKLLNVAGAYWRGDEKNKMLQRIYGTAFSDKKSLKKFLHQQEEAKKRDHRKLGKELDLFSFHTEAPANPMFHPKGAFIYNSLIEYIRDLYSEFGYDEVITPQILDVSLWKKSGHYENYEENMYFTNIEEREYAVKPMNCPTHVLIYKTGLKSYRNLPIRYADFGRLHRYEKSGALAGLFRVRTFSQDDAHIFCTHQQISQEISALIKMIFRVYKTFGFDKVFVHLATKPDKSIGSDQMWINAESSLKKTLESEKIDYKINEGDGAFYGPKIDFKVLDAIGRQWQLGTIQLDFSMPSRFGLTYMDSDGKEKIPVMIHRALLGSIERFMGILIEHFAGKFPVWLSPEKARIIPVGSKFNDYAFKVEKEFKGQGIPAKVDSSDEKLNYKIRQAQMVKIPFMVILGDKEESGKAISVRHRDGSQENDIPAKQLIDKIRNLVNIRALEI